MHHETLIIVLVSACLLTNLITLAVVIMSHNRRRAVEQDAKLQVAAALSPVPVQGIVFCRSCGNQFDSTLDVCPHCKTTR
jgi:rubrerythrin